MSPLTLSELKERLQRLDIDALLDILRVTPEEAIEAFSWKIEERHEELERLIDDFE